MRFVIQRVKEASVRVDGETRELALKEARISLENLRDVEPLAAWEEASA